MCTIYKFVCSDCFFYFLSEKEAKIAKEKALGIYKERKVTADGLKNCEIRAGIFVWARQDDRKFVWGGKWSGSIIYLFVFFVVRQGESWSVRQKMAKWAVTQFVSRKSTGHIWCRMICSYLPAVQPAAASTLTAYLLEICTLHNPVKKPLILLLRLSVCALDSLCLKCLRLFFWQNVSDPKEEQNTWKVPQILVCLTRFAEGSV